MAKRRVRSKSKSKGRIVVSKSGRKYKKTASGRYVKVGRQLRVKAHLRKRRVAKKARKAPSRKTQARKAPSRKTRRSRRTSRSSKKRRSYTGQIRSSEMPERLYGYTFVEWLGAAGRQDSASEYDLRAAWRAGEEPADYR